ncbi:hypothetical protein [Bifidobacterium lemurum]|nr:hypothetical protein [Bifidobacterium lemurum]
MSEGSEAFVERVHNDIAYGALQEESRRMQERCNQANQEREKPLIYSHITALALLGAELPKQTRLSTNALHVAVRNNNARYQQQGIKRLRWSNGAGLDQPYIVGDVQCVPPAVAWAQMAQYLTLSELVVLADSLTRRDKRMKLCERNDFVILLAESGLFWGKQKCKKALRLMKEDTDSSQETRTRLVLRQHGLPDMEVNHAVYDDAGDHIWLLDMAFPDQKVCIEYQGDQHRTDKHQYRQDNIKQRHLRDMGWAVICATAKDLSSAEAKLDLARSVAKALHMRLPPKLTGVCRYLLEEII